MRSHGYLFYFFSLILFLMLTASAAHAVGVRVSSAHRTSPLAIADLPDDAADIDIWQSGTFASLRHHPLKFLHGKCSPGRAVRLHPQIDAVAWQSCVRVIFLSRADSLHPPTRPRSPTHDAQPVA